MEAGDLGQDGTGAPGHNRAMTWGSDVAAEVLARLGIPYVALVPGASFRGFHDSLVNYLGADAPGLLVCLHEEHAVAIAEGWGRVTGVPMAVALHSNVGLMHATMPIYNAWCDRTPVLVIGATGPVDAHRRRPWIEWVHTSADQGGLVRDFVKWDDQPASAEAVVESLLRAYQIASTVPGGPVYVCLDVGVQEEALDREIVVPDVSRYTPGGRPAAAADEIARAVDMLADARRPVVLMGRMSRDETDWQRRIDLAEALGAPVLTSIFCPPAFPTTHQLHRFPLVGEQATEAEKSLIDAADVILSFDWVDLSGFLRRSTGCSQTQLPVSAKIIQCSLEHTVTNGWSMDHQALPPADLRLLCDPDEVVRQLLDAVRQRGFGGDAPLCAAALDGLPDHWTGAIDPPVMGGEEAVMPLALLAHTIAGYAKGRDVSFARLPIGWPSTACRFEHPLDYLGKDIGGAVGTGPGNTIGTALALRTSGRITIGVLGDGDFLMGANALWTAANFGVPVIFVIANNLSYYNDVRHQETVALQRGRPVENKWVGQSLDDPRPDIPGFARAQGFAAETATTPDELLKALEIAEKRFRDGTGTVIDARVAGY